MVGVPRQLLASLVAPNEVLLVLPSAVGVQIKRAQIGSGPEPIPIGAPPMRSADRAAVDESVVRDPRTASYWRRMREEAAAKYQPEEVRLLLVAEAPPSAPDRYFYFPGVPTQDSLFRYVVRLVLGLEPTRIGKPQDLERLQAAGVFLIDLCVDPLSERDNLGACVPDLVARAAAHDPEHIIVIKTRVYDEVAQALRKAGLPLVSARIPFPGSGQQLRFEIEMRAALDAIDRAWPRVAY